MGGRRRARNRGGRVDGDGSLDGASYNANRLLHGVATPCAEAVAVLEEELRASHKVSQNRSQLARN